MKTCIIRNINGKEIFINSIDNYEILDGCILFDYSEEWKLIGYLPMFLLSTYYIDLPYINFQILSEEVKLLLMKYE